MYSTFASSLMNTVPEPIQKTIKTGVDAAISRSQVLMQFMYMDSDRAQQLQELGLDASLQERNEQEKEANFLLGIAVAATGAAVVARLVFTPLIWVSVAAIVYTQVIVGRDAYRKMRDGQGIFTVELVDFVTLTSMFMQGFILLTCFDCIIVGIAYFMIEKVKDNSRSNTLDVFRQQPKTAWIRVGDTETEVPIEDVQVGDIVVVHAGEAIPIDGIIVSGVGSVDQRILTGESQPAEKGVGESVFAMTVVLSGTIQIEIQKAGEETAAAQINHILNNTIDFKSGQLLHSEEIADKTVWPMFLLGALAYPFIGIASAIAVVDSHFKRKMSIAGPIGMLNFFGEATKSGILIKDGRTFELLPEIDTIVFDKTGTLTEEQPHVGQIFACNGASEELVLQYAATVEYKQSHPIAKAIIQEANTRQLQLAEIQDTKYEVGYGLSAVVDDERIRVGSMRFLLAEQIEVPHEMMQAQDACNEKGHSLVFVANDTTVIGAIELRATVRPEAKEVIEKLKERNIKSFYIISGDREAPTKHLAEELGIDHYFAETLPENKADLIDHLQSQGKSVCFVGDGINDSIALKKAKVSVSLSGASSIAIDTAQVVLMDQSLANLYTMFDIAHDMERNMDTMFKMILAPCGVALAGALFFGFTQYATIPLNMLSLGLGVTTAMRVGSSRQKELPLTDS
ncbi:MAG: heavy metal translocating P-type ATPase [Chloroflexota bacterium]